MSLTMLGEKPANFPYGETGGYFRFYSIVKGDQIDAVEYVDGAGDLNKALWLWDLFDQERRARMLVLLNDEIQGMKRYLEDHGYASFIVTTKQARQYLELLDDVGAKAQAIVDDNGFVLPEQRAFAKDRMGFVGFLSDVQDSDGMPEDEYYLGDKIDAAKPLKVFLSIALEHNRELWLD